LPLDFRENARDFPVKKIRENDFRELFGRISSLFRIHNLNFRTRHSFARERAHAPRDEFHYAVTSSVNGEIAAHVSARAGNFCCANLADNHFSFANFLAAKTLDTQAVASVVVYVMGGSARFDM
jgi:hypothetical protein